VGIVHGRDVGITRLLNVGYNLFSLQSYSILLPILFLFVPITFPPPVAVSLGSSKVLP
jgi:hypothetical protein